MKHESFRLVDARSSSRLSGNRSPARRARWIAMAAVAAALGLMAGPASAFRYGATTSFAVGDSPDNATVHDLNGDGHLDVVATNFWPSTVTVLLGNGAGSLTFSAAYSVAVNGWTNPTGLAIADFDENGAPDIAVAVPFGIGGGVVIRFGDGSGAFPTASSIDVGTIPGGDSPKDVAAGDLNGDGHADLVTLDAGNEGMSALLGRGDGTFEASLQYSMADPDGEGNGCQDIELADLDGDGDLDAAAVFDMFGQLAPMIVRMGNGDGSFGEARSYAGPRSPFNLALGDVDGDGDPDAVLATNGLAGVSILFNDGTGVFGSHSTSPVGPSGGAADVVIADLDEDGIVDIAAVLLFTDSLAVLKGSGDGTFTLGGLFPVGDAPVSLATGDFDEDGSPDLVATNSSSDDMTLLLRPDADDDGLSRAEETALGTDPFDSDTDDDALSDGDEVTLGTNPLDADSDNDELGDGDEVALGTDPLDADSDDDGLPDGTEGELGTDPLDSDSDDDGIADGEDPSLIADIVEGLPDGALHSGGNRNALIVRLASIEENIAEGEFNQALSQLENLRQRVDGCTPESPDPDSNDWITDSEAQMQVRALIDALIALLGGV